MAMIQILNFPVALAASTTRGRLLPGAEGKIWVAFTCDALSAGETMSTCPVDQGYVLFESCLTGTP